MPDPVKKLLIGDVLQLQHAPPSENPERYAVKLVGYVPGQSLVITTPGKQGKAILVREGHAFTVRLLQGSNIFGFVAKVLAVFSKPYPHLHLSYPEEVASAVVRNAPRVPTRLRAQVSNLSVPEAQRHRLSLDLNDLSSTGCQLVSDTALGAVEATLQISLTLEVCGSNDQLQVLGAIRNIRESTAEGKQKSYIHGIQFKGLNRFHQLLLCAYVLGQIAKERG
ncbi:MAG: flagellar brake protein [Gammaproteobacteria bacterium]|nr:flagellar brake protein [Gammaproteobacteria bacterium]